MEEDYKKLLPADFDFEAFQKEAIKKLKAGKPLSGKDGVMMPLIKRIVEAALKGEVEAHLDAEPRRPGTGRTEKALRPCAPIMAHSNWKPLATETPASSPR